MNEVSDYAFELYKEELKSNEEGARERVTAKLKEKFSLGEDEAKQFSTEAFERWMDIYYPD